MNVDETFCKNSVYLPMTSKLLNSIFAILKSSDSPSPFTKQSSTAIRASESTKPGAPQPPAFPQETPSAPQPVPAGPQADELVPHVEPAVPYELEFQAGPFSQLGVGLVGPGSG